MTNNSIRAPEGFHTVTPYLIVADAARALEFYEEAFGVEVTERNTDANGRIMHAEIKIGDSMVMLGEHNEVSQQTSGRFPPVSIYLYVSDVDALAKRAISAGATEVSPVKDQDYGNREGGIKDPFGIVWWVATPLKK